MGAAALGDISSHFPSSGPRWKDATSLAFLTYTRDLLAEQGWRFGNVDTVIVAERPRMTPHISAIRAELARQLAIDLEQISVKAKTTDGLGFTGREEGIGIAAVALFERSEANGLSNTSPSHVPFSLNLPSLAGVLLNAPARLLPLPPARGLRHALLALSFVCGQTHTTVAPQRQR